MKKLFFTLALALGMVATVSAQQSGLFGYGPAKGGYEDYSTNSTNRDGLLGLPTSHGNTNDVQAPLGMGTMLLLGMGAAYAMNKSRKNKKNHNSKFFLIAAIVMAGMIAQPTKVVGQERTDINITASSFGSSYTTSTNDPHTFTAGSIGFADINVMKNGNNAPIGYAGSQLAQFKKSAGYCYNTSAINTISSIDVELVVNTNSFSIYYGDASNPTNDQNKVSSSSITPTDGTFYYTSNTSSNTSVTSKIYSFDLSSYDATFFRLACGSDGVIYVASITIHYSSGPSTTVSTTSLTGFTYAHGTTPTQTKSFKINGANLTNNITVSLNNANFVMSESENSNYSTENITVPKGNGTVTDKTIYVRQASGLGINNEYSGTITVASTGVSTNKTVSLSGSVTGYTVTYNANEATTGTVPTDATAYEMSQPVTVKPNSGSLAKTHFTFGGWNTKADGTGTNYEAGTGTFNITANTTLYAKWVPITHLFNTATATSNNTYPVSSSTVVAKDSGDNTVASGSQVAETTQLTLTATPESGFVFGSWIVSGENSTLSSTSTNPTTFTMGTADASVSATFIPTHTFTYSVNNNEYGSVGVNPNVATGSAVAEGRTFTVTATPTNANFKFKQWNVTGTGSGVTSTTDASTTFTMGTVNATLQAEFAPVYTVTYAANGGTGTMTDPNSPYFVGTEVTLLGNTFTYIGHTFSHWTAEDALHNNVTITDGKITMPASAVTVSANWTTESYACTLSKTGESEHATAQLKVGNEVAGSTIPYGTEVTIEVTPESGYTYTVSAKDGSNNEVTITNNQFTVPANTVAVTVNVLKIYNVAIASNIYHGTVNADPVSGVIGDHITLSSTPVKGYCLYSWDVYKTNDPATKVTVTNNKFDMPAYDVTVSALFSPAVTDVLTLSTTGVTGTSYSTWSGKTSNSDAVYAGTSAGGNSAIQLTNSSSAGIVTTSSGGKAKKIVVTWNSNTSDGRTLDIYGKGTSSYTSGGNLYNANTDGSKLGSIVYGSSTELTIDNDTVIFLGMRSNKNAMYLDTIKITWGPTPYTLSYDANGGSGELIDHGNPYIFNMEATVLSNTFTAPTDKVFHCWNANAAGDGKDYYPGDTVLMPRKNKTLYAKWADPCDTPATMNATTGEAQYVNNSGSLSYKINLSSSVSALSNCAAIVEYGFVYSTSVEDPTVGAENCTKIVKGNTDPTVNAAFTDEIANVTLNTIYYIRSYATNLAGTAYGTKATVIIDEDYPSYIISYTTNGKAEATTTKVYQGNTISELLETPTASFIPSGYSFKGWYDSNYNHATNAPTYVAVGDDISNDMTLKAVFAESSTSTQEVTKSYGFETASDSDWTINGPVRSDENKKTGSYSGKITTNNTYVTFKNKVKVKNFSFEFIRTSGNDNYNVYIETSTNNSDWTAIETYAMSSFTQSTWTNKSHAFNGETAYYVRFHCYNTTAVRYVDDVTIKYDVEVPVYSNYCTSVADIITPITTNTERTNDIPNYEFITVQNGATLTLSGNNLGDASNIVVEDGGQLIVISSGAKDGVQATMQKDITAWTTNPVGGWYFISSPLSAATAPTAVHNMIPAANIDSDQYDLYRFNQSAEKEWQNYKVHHDAAENPFSALVNGQGYLYANGSTTTLEFSGTVPASDNNITVSSLQEGYNLVGNPYTCNAYINSGYYMLTGGNTVSATLTGKDNAITPCTGIIVESEAGGSVKFSKDYPVTAVNHGNLQMTLAQTVTTRGESTVETLDNAIVSFNEDSKLGKFYFGSQDANIYIPQNGKEFAIVSAEAQGEMPVNFKANQNGQYTLTVNAEDVEMNYLHLIDNITGADVDMLANSSYTFNAQSDDYESRFRLVFSAQNNNNDINAEMGDDFAFISNGQLVINGTGTLQVIDMLGRVMLTQELSTLNSQLSTLNFKSGVYVLRLTSNGESKTQKIVVK